MTYGRGMSLVIAVLLAGCVDEIPTDTLEEPVIKGLDELSAPTDLVLPFPPDELHVVTQTHEQITSHAIPGYEQSIDFAGRAGSPVVAPMSGTVLLLETNEAACPEISGMPETGRNSGFGNHLYIENQRSRVHLAHLGEIVVRDGEDVVQGQLLGYEGSTGCATGPNIHLDCSVMNSGSVWQSVDCMPLSGYESFEVGESIGGEVCNSLPVGTTVKTYDRPEIYLVCAPNRLCHIADWDAYTSRRFFYYYLNPTDQVVMMSESELNCYQLGEPIEGVSERYLVDCIFGEYLIIREGGRAVRRWNMYEEGVWGVEREVLLMSWGIDPILPEYRPYSFEDCIRVDEGDPLWLRDGTVIEFPDDNDFYVITGDAYENEADPRPEHEHGVALRLSRDIDGEPFFPMLYGSFNRVLMVNSASFHNLINRIHPTNAYDYEEACACSYGSAFGGPGQEVCGDGNCSVGESCHDCAADCGACPSTSVCGDGICQIDEGLYVCPVDCSEGPFCGDGICENDENCRNCELDCVVCTEPEEPDVPDRPDAPGDPPYTIRCELSDDIVDVHITGPVLDRLIDGEALTGPPTGIYIGSNGLGRWSVPYPMSDPRPFLHWPGGDGSGSISVPVSVGGLNLAVADADGHVRWFDIEIAMTPQTWRVVGDCQIDGTLIYFESGGEGVAPEPEPEPEPEPYCGDGSCDADETCSTCSVDCGACPVPEPTNEEHTIECLLTEHGLEMLIYGPISDMLIGSMPAEPVGIYAGCNNCGGWSIPYSSGDPRPLAYWVSDDEVYSLVFPTHASGINLVVVGAAGHQAWFDIETAMNAERWNVIGDCRIEGTLIVQD